MHDRRLNISIGLGPVVASLCLGSPANISFRSKANQTNGISCAEITLSFILSHGVSLSLEPSSNPATDWKCASMFDLGHHDHARKGHSKEISPSRDALWSSYRCNGKNDIRLVGFQHF